MSLVSVIGRFAYHNPMEILGNADSLYDANIKKKSVTEIINEMLPYIQSLDFLKSQIHL